MSEIVNIHARNLADLTTPTETPVDSTVFDAVKIPVGNLPVPYKQCEALTLGQIKTLFFGNLDAKLSKKADSNSVYLKKETYSKEESNALLLRKADVTSVYSKEETYSKTENDQQLSTKANQGYVDAAIGALNTDASKQYATLDLANADITNIPLNKNVFVSESTNGGYWYKATTNATTLTKSPYDPLPQAKADATTKANVAEENAKNYADKKIKAVADEIPDQILQDDSKSIIQVIDKNYDVVAEIDQNAHLHLPGLSDSVQNEINEQKKVALNTVMINELLHALTDDNDEIVFGVDLKGGVRVVGLAASVQEKIGVKTLVSPTKTYTKYHNLSEESKNCVLSTLVSSKQFAPAPFNLLPHDYSISTEFINQLELTIDSGYVPVDTTYASDDLLVHPYIIEFRGGFRGYRYLMCITPLLIEPQENPHVFGSHDLTSWELLTGFEQPVDRPRIGRFLSDNCFTYDPINGMLILVWRDSLEAANETPEGGAENTLWYKATYDGVEWTDKQLLMSPQVDKILSPAILYDPRDGLWHLWTGKAEGTLMHFTAPHLNNAWELQSTQTFGGLWHFEVKYVGDKYVMLADVRVSPHNYIFAVSTDGNTWTQGSGLFKDGVSEAYYKPTFITDYVGDNINFNVFFTVHNPSKPENLARKRKLLRARTNSIIIA